MSRISFPEGFHWGAATSAFQIEGAASADGKGESIWDRFCRRPGATRNGADGDRACNSYSRYEEDVKLLHEMNLNSYHFSLSWSRIQPQGSGAPNAAGLDHYRRLMDALLGAGIRPFPSLYHWDLPQPLEDRDRGWTHRDTAGRFSDYAEIVARSLGDLAPCFTIFDEPETFVSRGYLNGVNAPGRRGRESWLRASHIVNLALAQAFEAMRASSNAKLGSSFALAPCEPIRDTDAHAQAAERWHRVSNLWHLEPALLGRYPDVFPEGLPFSEMGVRDGDLDRIFAPLDFIGVSLDTRVGVESCSGGPLGIDANACLPDGLDVGPKSDQGREVWPDALYDMLMRLTRDYDTPVIEITGNGFASAERPDSTGRIDDRRRIDFHEQYLHGVGRAIADGADIRSYHVAGLLDGFEWADGYEARRGLVWVDFETGDRRLKQSGHWLAEVADANGFEA